MTGLLICAAVLAWCGWTCAGMTGAILVANGRNTRATAYQIVSLALIAVALWLAYAAGGA